MNPITWHTAQDLEVAVLDENMAREELRPDDDVHHPFVLVLGVNADGQQTAVEGTAMQLLSLVEDVSAIVHQTIGMTAAQVLTLRRLCFNYHVTFDVANYGPRFDLPSGYVAGWIGDRIYVGVSPEGEASS